MLKQFEESFDNVLKQSLSIMDSPVKIFLSELNRIIFPLKRMTQNFILIVKPYSKPNEILQEFIQPLQGLVNIALGFLALIGLAIALAVSPIAIIMALCFLLINPKAAIYAFINAVTLLLMTPITIISHIASGLIQLATTPLLILKIPVRGLLTNIEKIKAEKIEKNIASKSFKEGNKPILTQLNSEKPSSENESDAIVRNNYTQSFFAVDQNNGNIGIDVEGPSINNSLASDK